MNAGGFVANEIVMAKTTASAGFSTEYMRISSVNSGSTPNTLTVVRGLSKGGLTVSSSYNDGQVLVSMGAVSGGFVYINAAPTQSIYGTNSPYIDIMNRTGSNPDDVVTQVRVGNLSGISSNLLYGNKNPGYGLYGTNVFLQGTITAKTGSFTGTVFVGSMSIGAGVNSGNNNGIFVNSNNYWYDNGYFKVGNGTTYITGSPSQISIIAQDFFVGSATQAYISGSRTRIAISSSNFSLDNLGNVSMSGYINANSGKIGSWTLSSGVLSSSFMLIDGNNSRISKTDDPTYYIDFSPTGAGALADFISMGTNFQVTKAGLLITSGALIEGVLTSSTGLIAGWQIASTSINKQDGAGLTVSTIIDRKYTFMGKICSWKHNLQQNSDLESTTFNVRANGDLTASSAYIKGVITATSINATGSGIIGGFSIDAHEISSSNNNLILRDNGQISASGVYIWGGSIGGWGTSPTVLSSSNVEIFSQLGGRIRMGATLPVSLSQGNGIFISGSGEILIGSASGYGLQFIGGNLFVSASNFFVGSKFTQYISGSGGNIEISSSGNVVKVKRQFDIEWFYYSIGRINWWLGHECHADFFIWNNT